MLEIAGVGRRDTVCDLGCGDGRICIEAARRYGARAIGVDIEAYWVEQAALNARAAGVTELVTFWQGDACDYDVSEATVVALYLVQTSMPVVAREVLGRAQPGTRVVSHSFPIEGCEAERVEEVIDPDGASHRIHLWIVGAGGGLCGR